jgi:4-carboxymuconolactone decarboxylase
VWLRRLLLKEKIMRLAQPRLTPLTDEEMDESIPKAGNCGPTLNIFATLARHPKLVNSWFPFGAHVLYQNTLPPRERELIILRVGWLSQSGYEWGQHVNIGRGEGLEEADFDRLREGPNAEGWSAEDRSLLRATDELHGDAFVTDDTWASLEWLSDEQKMDLVFTVGEYMLVSMALNTFGVQTDEGCGGLDSGGSGL